MIGSNLLEGLSDNIVIDKDKCVFCSICVETCPMDNLRMKLSPCRQACPLGVNVQGYIQLIARGEELKAMELLRETLPFPGILGRICSQPCEGKCHRKKIEGETVAIRALKRYLSDKVSLNDTPPLPDIALNTGKKAAIIGSGPAGLMAAYTLGMKGYIVTIFEAEDAPGGMLRWAIPEFRLPLEVLEKELGLLQDMGINLQCGISLGQDKTINELKDEFNAIVIATGCSNYSKLGIEGEDIPGIYHGLPFLHEIRSGRAPTIAKKVVVIGGGNVAVDAAQTALRLGAKDVTMVCLESRDEIPSFPWAIEGALSEGIKLECSWGPTRFFSRNGILKGVNFQRCLRVFDKNSKFKPCFDTCELMSLEADTAIVAIGQTPDRAFLKKIGLTREKGTTVDPITLQSPDEMIFLAGDVAGGPSTVVEAMASGRKAAVSVDRFLKGEHLYYGREYIGPVETEFEIDISKAAPIKRAKIPQRQFKGEMDFREIEQGLDKETARQEARRCYSCGQPFGKFRTCWFCLPCEVECPYDALRVEIPYLLR